jgi:hypothetical protein
MNTDIPSTDCYSHPSVWTHISQVLTATHTLPYEHRYPKCWLLLTPFRMNTYPKYWLVLTPFQMNTDVPSADCCSHPSVWTQISQVLTASRTLPYEHRYPKCWLLLIPFLRNTDIPSADCCSHPSVWTQISQVLTAGHTLPYEHKYPNCWLLVTPFHMNTNIPSTDCWSHPSIWTQISQLLAAGHTLPNIPSALFPCWFSAEELCECIVSPVSHQCIPPSSSHYENLHSAVFIATLFLLSHVQISLFMPF